MRPPFPARVKNSYLPKKKNNKNKVRRYESGRVRVVEMGVIGMRYTTKGKGEERQNKVAGVLCLMENKRSCIKINPCYNQVRYVHQHTLLQCFKSSAHVNFFYLAAIKF